MHLSCEVWKLIWNFGSKNVLQFCGKITLHDHVTHTILIAKQICVSLKFNTHFSLCNIFLKIQFK